MNRPLRCVAVPALFLASILGCNKSKETSAEKKPEEKVAVTTCSDKAFKHTSPNFCLDVPAGYTAKPEEKTNTGAEVNFQRPDDYGFGVSWGRWATAEEALKAYKSPLEQDEKLVEEANLPGGGYFRHTAVDDYHHVASVVKGTKSYVVCYVETKQMDVITASVTACKNIHVD